MKDALQIYEENSFEELAVDQDPFQEKAEPLLLGQSFYELEGLSYLLDNPTEINIVATNSEVIGKLQMNLVPCDENGCEDLDEDLLPDEPQDLINKSLNFKVKIDKIIDLPESFCRDIYIQYKFYT